MEKIEFKPVLIGSDLNCYSVARAFHEEYGVRSIAVAKMELGPILGSKIIDFIEEKNLNDKDVFINLVRKIGKDINSKGLLPILIGCSDIYVEMIIDNKDELGDLFILPYMDKNLKDKLIYKENFYKLCDEVGLDHPKTRIFKKGDKLDIEGLQFPLILKPSDSVEYWKVRFEGMEKVYYSEDEVAVKKAIESMYSGPYEGNIIIQEYIPGGDSYIWTPTCYSDKNANVVMVTLGHVLLEEHVPTARGNDAAIVVEYNEELMEKITNFLNKIGYIGFCNWDIKYDQRDGKFKVFEINIRQGRSNYHVTACGNNLAKLVVEDYIQDKKIDLKYQKEEHFWSLVPDHVIKNYTEDKTLVEKALKLKKQGKYSSTLFYDYDLRLNPKRYAYVMVNYYNHVRKYKKYGELGE